MLSNCNTVWIMVRLPPAHPFFPICLLLPTENPPNPPFPGTATALPLSIPAGSSAASHTGSVTNFSTVSAPTVGSAWLLSSAAATSFQPLRGSAYLYQQHSATTMLSAVPAQSQTSMSAASYPAALQWHLTAGTAQNTSALGHFTQGTRTNQNTAVPCTLMTAPYHQTTGANATVPLFPSFIPGTAAHIPTQQGHGLSLPYLQASQIHDHHQATVGSLLSAQPGPCLQTYAPGTHTATVASAPYPEMVMVLRQIQPTDDTTPVSTSATYYSASSQPATGTTFQGEWNQVGSKGRTSKEVKPAFQRDRTATIT